MDITAIIDVLRWANGQERMVRLVLRDGHEIQGVPSSLDLHPTAHEVFLHPAGDDESEIGISLAAIVSAELL